VKALAEKAEKELPGARIETETKIKIEGSNRRPDVQAIDTDSNQTIKVWEAERNPGSKRNQAREEEYDSLGIEYETHPVDSTGGGCSK